MTRRRTATHVSWLTLFLALILASLHLSLAEDAASFVASAIEAGKANPNDPEVNYDAINPNRPDKSQLFFKPAHSTFYTTFTHTHLWTFCSSPECLTASCALPDPDFPS
jgi:hypothetical protein